jgi:pimeloyl-ACP methyl ester carboxylesterase
VPDALLLIHAWPLDATMWEPQETSLRERVLTVAPHLPGFGGTDPAGDVMTMRAAADRCVEALDAAGAERSVVCGLSLGGYVALELWRSHPDRVTGFVFANTRAIPDDEAGKERRRVLVERLRKEGSGFLVKEPGPLLSDQADQEQWERVRTMIAAQSPDAIASAALGMAERPDSTGDLSGIDVPTMVITSTGDTLIPSVQTTPMADAIPSATLEVIEGAGHLSSMESPGEFTLLLERQLTLCGLL